MVQSTLTRRRAIQGLAVTLAAPGWAASGRISGNPRAETEDSGKSPIIVDDLRSSADGLDWAVAFNRALNLARRERRNVMVGGSGRTTSLLTTIEIIPAADGWTPTIFANDSHFILGNVGAGFRYRGRKDGALENPRSGGLRDCVIDYASIGDPKVNSGPRGIYLSNGGGSLRFERVRGVNMFFGCHIQNWRYADGGSPGGGITTVDCDCHGWPSDDRSHKWYPFCDQGDVTIDMPGDTIAVGASAVIATPQNRVTGYAAQQPARALFWTNNTGMPVRIPDELSEEALKSAGLTQGKETGVIDGLTLSALTVAYWKSGGKRQPDCVIQAQTGLIDGADHDGGYYGTMLQGTREYVVKRYRTRNNVRGIAGQEGAKNVRLNDVEIRRSVSSAILAGYNASGWTIDNFIIEASNDRWVGEALINLQLGASGARIGRGEILMGDDQKTGQYAVKFGPNSPNCRIDGPLLIKGDCAKAYVAVESAWDRKLSSKYKESYAQIDYSGIASQPMTNIRLCNLRIEAQSVRATVPTAIAIIQANDGSISNGFHGPIGVSDLIVENVVITSTKHECYLKLIESDDAPSAGIRNVVLRNFLTPPSGGKSTKLTLPDGMRHFRCAQNVSNLADHCPAH